MSTAFLHQRKDFKSLISTLSAEKGILEALVEKDYWIMHVLCGMKNLGLEFELKGGTSLSKGFKIIDRFSEDIDLHITPPKAFIDQTGIKVNENPKSSGKNIVENRMKFFDWLKDYIRIDGIIAERDTEFDDKNGRNGGIRLKYDGFFGSVPGIKDGILLEVGFAKVTPNENVHISSWMYDKAIEAKLKMTDNRAMGIACYHPGYTLVEKLQTIVTKFRVEQGSDSGGPKVNFMRQYYDVYRLLQRDDIQKFIITREYSDHKLDWFPEIDLDVPLSEKEAFTLTDNKIREDFKNRYIATSGLYYLGQPEFDEILGYIQTNLKKLG
ncbi:nucleotidyl transferase AbiEii/AbiGii toxin family protein [Pedobacter foliorum]|uniref:nucleotidyl transferase AbiEii/AbiGii toxin family protein n=1 Tax=Pedobacter foliorum TaxID=2739058 RepID=UPI0015638CA7|nr:nucleotidyl transferase AbiEii/AbiGii toxin family protein [Pedobacter foliorum]NRF37398.1 nucleotidyl transferase AbiEii/AbiGii toxin family protein [Pedobacter foliorum]